jgi:hypothetical protein
MARQKVPQEVREAFERIYAETPNEDDRGIELEILRAWFDIQETEPDGPRFSLGVLLFTPGARDALTIDEIHDALDRHVRGDWGDVDVEDASENEFALGKYLRLFSVYTAQAGKFWIITEADRRSTTVLLPSEY